MFTAADGAEESVSHTGTGERNQNTLSWTRLKQHRKRTTYYNVLLYPLHPITIQYQWMMMAIWFLRSFSNRGNRRRPSKPNQGLSTRPTGCPEQRDPSGRRTATEATTSTCGCLPRRGQERSDGVALIRNEKPKTEDRCTLGWRSSQSRLEVGGKLYGIISW